MPTNKLPTSSDHKAAPFIAERGVKYYATQLQETPRKPCPIRYHHRPMNDVIGHYACLIYDCDVLEKVITRLEALPKNPDKSKILACFNIYDDQAKIIDNVNNVEISDNLEQTLLNTYKKLNHIIKMIENPCGDLSLFKKRSHFTDESLRIIARGKNKLVELSIALTKWKINKFTEEAAEALSPSARKK